MSSIVATPAIPAAIAATVKPVIGPRVTDVELGVHVDDAMNGRPADMSRASASATTRYALDAPAGARLQVDLPTGVGFNAWAWGNDGKSGVSFAKEGASWIATTKVPVTQISLQTSAFVSRGDDIRIDGQSVDIGDLTAKLTVDGVAPASTDAPVHVIAPRGWATAAKDGTADVLANVRDVDDTVAGQRPAGHGVPTVATFTGRDVDGSSAVGPGRTISEAVERTKDAAASGLYTLLAVTGLAP